MASSDQSSRDLARGTGIVSLLTLLSRFLGFVRDVIVARLLGAGLYADVFFVAFRIPNLLRSFVAEGAFTAAFVPVFVSEFSRGKQQARAAIRQTAGMLLLSTLLLTVLGAVFAREIVALFAPGFALEPAKLELCVYLTRIMFAYVIFVSLVAMINGALNAVKVFGASAWAQVWMNLVLILGALLALGFESDIAVRCLAYSVIAGGIIQVIVQFPALKRAAFLLAPTLRFWSPATRQIVRLMLPALLGATVYQLSIFINTLLASLLQEGSVSWLYYADRLAQLPIGIFSIALASVLLPTLAQASANKDQALFARHLQDALRYTSFVILPLACFLFFGAEPLTRLIYERGQFTRESSINTALAIQAYSLGLWATSCHSMLVRAFIANKDTQTPVVIGVISLVCGVAVSVALMGPVVAHNAAGQLVNSLGSWLPTTIDLGHVGIAAGSSAGAFVALVCSAVLLSRSVRVGWMGLARSLCTAALASSAVWVSTSLSSRFAPNALLEVSCLAICSLLGFIAISALCRSPELKETFSLFHRLLGGALRRRGQ